MARRLKSFALVCIRLVRPLHDVNTVGHQGIVTAIAFGQIQFGGLPAFGNHALARWSRAAIRPSPFHFPCLDEDHLIRSDVAPLFNADDNNFDGEKRVDVILAERFLGRVDVATRISFRKTLLAFYLSCLAAKSAATASPSVAFAWHRRFGATNRDAREKHTRHNEIPFRS